VAKVLVLVCSSELAPSQIGEQCRQGPIEDGRVVARGYRVPEHVLREPQLLERCATDRDLEPVAIR